MESPHLGGDLSLCWPLFLDLDHLLESAVLDPSAAPFQGVEGGYAPSRDMTAQSTGWGQQMRSGTWNRGVGYRTLCRSGYCTSERVHRRELVETAALQIETIRYDRTNTAARRYTVPDRVTCLFLHTPLSCDKPRVWCFRIDARTIHFNAVAESLNLSLSLSLF